jgi:broad-specificity NMP kinase
MEHINIGETVKQGGYHCGMDTEYDCLILDEDKLCDALEPRLAVGGKVVDHHCSDFYPERWFDVVVVLQTDNTVLYDRLTARGYSQKKITDNVECEIFQTVTRTISAFQPASSPSAHATVTLPCHQASPSWAAAAADVVGAVGAVGAQVAQEAGECYRSEIILCLQVRPP